MVTFAAFVAALLYLVPVAVVTLDWALREDAPASSLALAIPNVVAIDLLGILLVTLFMPLHAAVLLARVSWLLAGVAVLVRGGARPRGGARRPKDLRPLIGISIALFVALFLSVQVSQLYSVWDREWHVPLVSSLRGQKLPFLNVFFASPLHYHFSGDVLAAVLQTLSFDVINSDHALSLAHDVMFGLTGVCLALLLRGLGHLRASAVALGVLAVLLNGPVTIVRGADAASLHGYSLLNFFTMSFRPHVSLAGLLLVGFLGSVVLRLRHDTSNRLEEGWFFHRVPVTLFATTALLSITDETTTSLLGLALGGTWLVYHPVVHSDRRRGLWLLVALLVAFVGANRLFGASLSRGGPVHAVNWVAWRAPGYLLPPISLALAEGRKLLFFDTLAIPLAFLGLLLCLRQRNVGRLGAALVFLGILDGVSLLGLTGFDVNDTPSEAHRFATAALFAAPLFALAWLPVARSGAFAKLLLLAGLTMPAFSTAAWLRTTAPEQLETYARPDLGRVNCRVLTDARWMEPTQPRYVAASAWYLWSGCHPTLHPGAAPSPGWDVSISGPIQGVSALASLDKIMLDPREALSVICPANAERAKADFVCAYALSRGSCTATGPSLQACVLDPKERRDLLRIMGR